MSTPVQLTLALGPLAAYFFVLGVWRGGRSPRVVSGPVDFGMLAFGLGGLIAFGPIGEALVRTLFPGPSVWAWLALAASWGLFSLIWAPRAARRAVVYNVDPAALRPALREALLAQPGEFAPTLRGFEDGRNGRGLTVQVAPGGRAATIEGYGDRPEALIAAIEPALREQLRGAAPPVSHSASLWFALSCLTLAVPLASLLSRPQVRAALRALLSRFQGG